MIHQTSEHECKGDEPKKRKRRSYVVGPVSAGQGNGIIPHDFARINSVVPIRNVRMDVEPNRKKFLLLVQITAKAKAYVRHKLKITRLLFLPGSRNVERFRLGPGQLGTGRKREKFLLAEIRSQYFAVATQVAIYSFFYRSARGFN